MGFLGIDWGRKEKNTRAQSTPGERERKEQTQRETLLALFQVMRDAADQNKLANCTRDDKGRENPVKGVSLISVKRDNFSVVATMKNKMQTPEEYVVLQVNIDMTKFMRELNMFSGSIGDIREEHPIADLNAVKSLAEGYIRNFRMFPPK